MVCLLSPCFAVTTRDTGGEISSYQIPLTNLIKLIWVLIALLVLQTNVERTGKPKKQNLDILITIASWHLRWKMLRILMNVFCDF